MDFLLDAGSALLILPSCERSAPGIPGPEPDIYLSKLADADAEATETQVWLDFALDCGYMSQERHDELVNGYEEVGKMLGKMMTEPEKFTMRNAEDKRQKAESGRQ